MPLELRRKKDGSLKSKYWYGSYMINGKRRVVSLGVEIAGSPPPSLREEGSRAFEKSRGKAEQKLEEHVRKARGGKSSEGLIQDLHAARYGTTIQAFPIKDLVSAWEAMPKKRRALNDRYAREVRATLQRFLDYLAAEHPKVTDAAQVDRSIARGFMQSEEARNIGDKTWNDSFKRLRATFRFLQSEYGVWRNPFDGIRMREEVHHHRRPLSESQVDQLLKQIEHDEICCPLIICGLSTAMRLGDCCQLKWSDVESPLVTPSITVKTSKTGETVCIPVYERLAKELARAYETRIPDQTYVWPAQAELYRKQRTLLSKRLRATFNNAVGKEHVHAEREDGHRKASVIDFHSLRTTWITEALTRGVPMETVKRISGHKTVEVVTKHYYHPSKSQVRRALEVALPPALTGGGAETKPSGIGRAISLLESMSEDSWMESRDEALVMLRTELKLIT